MRRVGLLAILVCVGCPTTNTPPDGGTDAFPGDAHFCQQGETCDCRAALMIPAGTHWVGTDHTDFVPYATPAHQVTLTRAFWLGTYEGTAGCYAACVRAGACTGEPDPQSSDVWPGLPRDYWRDPNSADLPIAGLDAQQAEAYCAWLGGRLPTNAEHEKAIRGEDGRSVPWLPAPSDPRLPPQDDSDNLCAHAAGCGMPALPEPVDSRPGGRGVYGHYHVVGNVNECMADGYALYTTAPAIDPFMPATSNENRIIRSQPAVGWMRNTYEFGGTARTGVRCAFDTPPAVFPR